MPSLTVLGGQPVDAPEASLILCTYQRPEALSACLHALAHQTVHAWELLLCPEPGPLARIRNGGLRGARAPVVVLCDDDTVPPPGWLAGVLATFHERPDIVGVTGPAVIPPECRRHRVLLRHRLLRRGYEYLFYDVDHRHRPGTLHRSGAVSYSDQPCGYEGPVQFLEACNMAFRTEVLRSVGGFDEAYVALGEWCEPDACFRIRRHLRRAPDEPLFWATPRATTTHRPAGGAATLRRRQTATRLANYELFRRRWVPPSWRSTLHAAVLRGYYATWGRWG